MQPPTRFFLRGPEEISWRMVKKPPTAKNPESGERLLLFMKPARDGHEPIRMAMIKVRLATSNGVFPKGSLGNFMAKGNAARQRWNREHEGRRAAFYGPSIGQADRAVIIRLPRAPSNGVRTYRRSRAKIKPFAASRALANDIPPFFGLNHEGPKRLVGLSGRGLNSPWGLGLPCHNGCFRPY